MRYKLIPGKEYLFTHKRRRNIRARFVRIARAPATDTLDEYYLECEMLDADLASRGDIGISPPVTLLRPSMIMLVQDVPANYSPSTLARFRPEEPSRRKRSPYLVRRLRRLLRSMRSG
jgi:hypothetical protein